MHRCISLHMTTHHRMVALRSIASRSMARQSGMKHGIATPVTSQIATVQTSPYRTGVFLFCNMCCFQSCFSVFLLYCSFSFINAKVFTSCDHTCGGCTRAIEHTGDVGSREASASQSWKSSGEEGPSGSHLCEARARESRLGRNPTSNRPNGWTLRTRPRRRRRETLRDGASPRPFSVPAPEPLQAARGHMRRSRVGGSPSGVAS